MKSHSNGRHFGLKDIRDIYPSTDANPLSDTGVLSAVEITVETLPHPTKPGNRWKAINLSQQAGFQLRNSYGLRHHQRSGYPMIQSIVAEEQAYR
jgi:hypothetical protein